MGIKTISDLNLLTKTTLSEKDLVLITDISAKETKNIEVSEYQDYTISKLDYLHTGSFTGSFFGHLKGNSDVSLVSTFSNLSDSSSKLLFTGENNGTASYSINSDVGRSSITSSFSVSTSYAKSSSFSLTSSIALSTSSRHSLTSNFSSQSLISDFSISASYLNYYGQNNGTSHSSSISERSNYSVSTDNLKSQLFSDVAISKVLFERAHTSDYSFSSKHTDLAYTSSKSEYSDVAERSIERIFSAVQFQITYVDDKITVTPTSWKNIKNISAGEFGRYYVDFFVTYKEQPKYNLSEENFAEFINLVTVGSFQLTNTVNSSVTDLPLGSKNNVPVWWASVFPCGRSGYILRFTHYTSYKMEKKAGWLRIAFNAGLAILGTFLTFTTGNLLFVKFTQAGIAAAAAAAAAGTVAGVSLATMAIWGGVAGLMTAILTYIFGKDSDVTNNGPLYQKNYLDGCYASAQSFCNTSNFTDLGPVYPISQFTNRPIISSSNANYIHISGDVEDFPAEDYYFDPSGKYVEDGKFTREVSFNNVKSIAHYSGSNYSLMLASVVDTTVKPNIEYNQIVNITGNEGVRVLAKSSHYPRTGSGLMDVVTDLKKIKFNNTSLDYFGITKNKLLFTSSLYVSNYTGEITDFGTQQDIIDGRANQAGTLNTYTPLWKTYQPPGVNQLCSADGLTADKYILITNKPYSLVPTAAENPPIYIVTNVKNQASELVSGSRGIINVTEMKVGFKDEKGNYVAGEFTEVKFNTTTLTDVAKINEKEAIVVGSNGVVLYGIDNVWHRVDYLTSTASSSVELQQQSIFYINNLYSVKVKTFSSGFQGNLYESYVIIAGSCLAQWAEGKSSTEPAVLYCIIPTELSDRPNANKWNWTPVRIGTTPEDDAKDNYITGDFGQFNDIFTENDTTVVSGKCSIVRKSYYNFSLVESIPPVSEGDRDPVVNINAVSKIRDNTFLMGGPNYLKTYNLTKLQ